MSRLHEKRTALNPGHKDVAIGANASFVTTSNGPDFSSDPRRALRVEPRQCSPGAPDQTRRIVPGDPREATPQEGNIDQERHTRLDSGHHDPYPQWNVQQPGGNRDAGNDRTEFDRLKDKIGLRASILLPPASDACGIQGGYRT